MSRREDLRSTVPADPDQALVARARGGDLEAFEDLVRAYQHRVTNFIRTVAGVDRTDAEDIAQEAFLRAYRGLRGFRGRSSFRTWLYRIVMNAARTHRSRRRQRPEEAAGDAATLAESFADRSAGHDPEAGLIARDAIGRALAALPPELRDAVVLRDVEGLDYREIAATLGVPLGTVESRIFRGRARLRDALAPSRPDLL